MKTLLAILLGFVPASLLHATPPTTDELIQQLQTAATESAKTSTPNMESRIRSANIQPYLAGMLTSLPDLIKRGDLNSIQQTLAQISSVASSDAVQKSVDALMRQIQDQISTREKTRSDEIDATVNSAVQAALAAKDPSQLDDFISKLSNLSSRQNYNDSSSQSLNRAYDKARSCITFLCRWQDYLAAVNHHDETTAQEVLRSLALESTSYSLVPRSSILDRMNPVSPSAEAQVPDLSGKKLSDVNDLGKQAAELSHRYPNSPPVQNFVSQVQYLQEAVEQARVGMYGQVFSFCTDLMGMQGGSTQFIPLRKMLLAEILPPYLGLEKTYPLQPGETPDAYLQRVTTEARSKNDWMTAWKALDASGKVTFNNAAPASFYATLQALNRIVVAQNYEQAGLYQEAIRAYQSALLQAIDPSLVPEIGRQLEMLKKDHPDDFQKASSPLFSPSVRTVPSAPISPR